MNASLMIIVLFVGCVFVVLDALAVIISPTVSYSSPSSSSSLLEEDVRHSAMQITRSRNPPTDPAMMYMRSSLIPVLVVGCGVSATVGVVVLWGCVAVVSGRVVAVVEVGSFEEEGMSGSKNMTPSLSVEKEGGSIMPEFDGWVLGVPNTEILMV